MRASTAVSRLEESRFSLVIVRTSGPYQRRRNSYLHPHETKRGGYCKFGQTYKVRFMDDPCWSEVFDDLSRDGQDHNRIFEERNTHQMSVQHTRRVALASLSSRPPTAIVAFTRVLAVVFPWYGIEFVEGSKPASRAATPVERVRLDAQEHLFPLQSASTNVLGPIDGTVVVVVVVIKHENHNGRWENEVAVVRPSLSLQIISCNHQHSPELS